MQSKRIAYVMTRFPKITETFILREMNELQHLGWTVEVFALVRVRTAVSHPGAVAFLANARFAHQGRLATVAANLRALVTQPHRYLGTLGQTIKSSWRSPSFLLRSLAAFPVAVRWASIVREQRIGQIHAHFATHAAYIAWVISRMTDIPYSFTAHAHDIYSERTMLGEKIAKASSVVTISHYNAQLLSALFPGEVKKFQVVRCGIDPDLFRAVPVKQSPSHDDVLRIACVARLHEMKGILYLAQACKALNEREVPFACTIAGDGPDRQIIVAYLATHDLLGHVTLAGWLPTARVAELLASVDVFVLPSVIARDGSMEGIPNVLMEAMSTQLPVVSTTTSGIPELVRSGIDGILVPPNDATALADALSYLAAHPAERQEMGHAGREHVQARFNLHSNVAAKAEIFAGIESDAPLQKSPAARFKGARALGALIWEAQQRRSAPGAIGAGETLPVQKERRA